MLTPGIGPRFIARNTPALGRTLRPIRHGRQNYAQYVAVFPRFRPPRTPNPPRLTTDGGSYRRFSHGWGWDPLQSERDALAAAAESRALRPAVPASRYQTAARRPWMPVGPGPPGP